MSSLFYCPPQLYSLNARRQTALENAPYPITAQINSVLALCELRYFSFADVTGFRMTRPDLLTGILFRVPTMGERVFEFLREK